MSLHQNGRGWGLAAFLLLGVATVALAQFGGAGKPAPVGALLEYTMQEVQANLLSDTLTDLGKQRWEVFQVLPVYRIQNVNAENELVPQRYQILGRRPAAPGAK